MPRTHHHFGAALAAVFALTGLALTAAPAHALTEAQQDAAISSLQSAVASLKSTVSSQQTTINTLTAKLQYVTASGHDLTLTGNLHVVSGVGKTNATPNGLGNVIIGYNEARAGNGVVNTRTGSHNLILGTNNNYSSYGGIVAGYGNEVSAGYASVIGGRNNTVSAQWASIGGGLGNTASATYAAVGGGHGNAAAATYAFLPVEASGQDLQTIQNQINTLTSTTAAEGKITNLFSLSTDSTRSDSQTNTELTLSGVNLHIVNGLGATNGEPSAPYDTYNGVVNGLGNLIIGYNEQRASDPNHPGTDARTGSHNLIVGTEENYSSFGGLVAGDYNTVSNYYSSVTGGIFNTASGFNSSVTGGDANTASDYTASVSGGYENTASNFAASVSGGSSNTASSSTSSVSGGYTNTASGGGSSVSGGEDLNEQLSYTWAAGSLQSP